MELFLPRSEHRFWSKSQRTVTNQHKKLKGHVFKYPAGRHEVNPWKGRMEVSHDSQKRVVYLSKCCFLLMLPPLDVSTSYTMCFSGRDPDSPSFSSLDRTDQGCNEYLHSPSIVVIQSAHLAINHSVTVKEFAFFICIV